MIRITISIGIAAMNDDYVTLDRLLKLADIALYQAKERGRNQVIVHR
jgi:diguanylate cyclase (GGDEF)-like protein